MAPHQILFCPFCRDSFEGLTRCPDHDLELVPFARLPASPHEHDPDDDEPAPAATPIAALDPRYGRGEVCAAALLNGAALVLPLGSGADDLGQHRTLALCAVFPVLWTVLLVSFTLLFVLARRRSLAGLHGLRLLVPALGLASPAALALVGTRLGRGPLHLLGGGSGASLCVLGAALLMAVGGARLGRAPGVR